MGFGRVRFQVEQLYFGRAFVQFQADPFPVAHPDGLLAVVFRELPVEEFVRRLFVRFPHQRRQEADAVGRRRFGSGQFGQRRHDVVERELVQAFRTRVDLTRPAGDKGLADTAFVYKTFAPAVLGFKRSGAVEIGRVRSAVVGGAVVAGEYDEGIFFQAQFPQFGHELPHFLIEVGDHGGVGSVRSPVGEVAFVADVGCFGAEFLAVMVHPMRRRLQGGVRDRGGIIEKEGVVLVLFDETEGFFLHKVRRIFPEPEIGVGG